MSENLDIKPRPHPEAAMERVDGRWMIATTDDRLHYLVTEGSDTPSDVGDRVVDLANGTRTVRDIADTISSEFEVEQHIALADVAELVGQLLERKVLVS